LSVASFVKSYLEKNRIKLAESYLRVTEFLKLHRIPYDSRINAGFFVSANVFDLLVPPVQEGAVAQSDSWAVQMRFESVILSHRLFLASGTTFGSQVLGWFRIVFSHSASYLDEGLRRLLLAAQELKSSLEREIAAP
jgi:hypothetical protein